MRKYLFDKDLQVNLRTMPPKACKLLKSRSSFHDATVWATRRELEQIFGDPTSKSKYKGEDVHYSWVLDLISQDERRVLEIYDMRYRNDKDENDFPPADVHIDWHIGGWAERETWRAKAIIEKRLREMRSGLIHEIKYVSVPEGNGERLYTRCPFGEKDKNGNVRFVQAEWCGFECPHNLYGSIERKVVICKHEQNMNINLVRFIESKEFRSDKKLSNLIMLNGRYLTPYQVRVVVRAAVSAGYTDLKSVPDEFAEETLKNSRR